MANPWEFNWQWDDLDTTPEAPKPVTTRQQLAAKSARANDPWSMNWDWGRAEAAAGAQDYDRLNPMVTTGDANAARYVKEQEFQMPELLHEEQSQRDFVRPKGEMFHARSYVPGAVAEQRVITEDLPWWEVPLRAVARGGEDVVQTGYAMAGGDPRDIPTMPLTTMDNPMTVEAAWENPEQAAKQSVTMISRLWPMMAAGYAGAVVSGVGTGAAAGAVGTEILGSTAGASAATFAQSMGPRFKQMLMQYPDDPERAWKEAGNATLLDVGFTGVGGLLIGAGPLGTSFKQAMFQTFGLRPMAELTSRQMLGNLAIQTLGAQPLVGVANMRAVDYYLGQDTGLTFGDEFLNNIAPSLVQTGAEFAGRAAIAPFAKKTSPGGLPGGGGKSEHFIDQIMEATELEKLAADFRTSPEIAAKIPEGLKYQIDNGEDPYRGYRDDLESLNSTLRSKLKETLQAVPEGEKKTGEQWYNTLRNAGVKEEELSDYGFDEMLNSDHNGNRKALRTIDQLRSQFHSNDYPIAMRELVPERYADGDNKALYEPTPDSGFETSSTPGMGEYRENLFVLEKDDATSLEGFARKRGIGIDALRRDAEAGDEIGALTVVGAKEKLALLREEHKAFKDYLTKNPEWKSKHARGEPLDATHWPQEDYGNVLMHTRTGELKFDDDGISSHHIDEIQSDVIQGMEGDRVRDMPEETALAASRYAYDEFSDKLAAERLGDLSYLDDSVRPGVDLSAKFDTLLENLGVETDKPYAWLTEARDKLIKFHDDPGSFSPEAQQKISSIIDPDRLPPIINKMRKDSARAQELVGEVLQAKNYAQAPASVPLRKSWSKAGLKAEIQRAISLGKKHISWTSGAVQMHRNDTGHRIGSLSATRESKGYYTVHVDGMNGRELLHRRHATAADIKKEFGDDLGSKLIKRVDESKGGYVELTQEEIGGATLGGKFHRKLYDEKMVQWAREIGKKFGKTPELKMYTAPDGTSHEMWVMELDPRMSKTMFRYQVGSEEKNLIAVRQMSVEGLRKAIELGGIPMPSLAIIKADNGLSALSSFSDDITLVGSRDLVDPEKGALAYDSDIYSPGTPATRYVIDPVAKTKLAKKLQGLASELKAPGITDDVAANVAKSGLVALSDAHAVVVQFARDMKHLKSGEKVMNSDGEGVTRLREWALAHPDFRGWLNSNFGNMIAAKKALWKDAKAGRGEKLSPFTLESMLRIMESKPIKGANTKSASVAYYRGLAAKKFGSIAEIKAESGKLLPREQTEAMFGELQDDFERTVEFMSRRAAEWSGEPYNADFHTRVAQNFIKEVLQSKGSAKRIAQTFENANATDIKEAADLIKRIDGTATSYFEVKVPGIVDFSRFAAAIVRSDRVSPEEVQALRDLGVKEVVVVRGDDQVARDLALSGLKHLRFQTGEQSDKQVTQSAGDTRKVSLTPKQQKQFRKLMANLVSEIKRINPLADVRFLDRFIGFTKDGSAIDVNGISHLLGIGVGLGKNKDPFGTARHEAGHTVMWLMDNLKAWKPGEREAFVEWYENVLSKKHENFLKNYKPEDRFEEAIVQELGVDRNKWKGYPQAVRNALYRIDGILKAIRTAVKRAFGRKLSPQDIAAMFDAGIMARRAIRKMRRLEGKTRESALARTPDGSLAYQITEETLKDFAISSQLDNTLYGKIDNPAIGTKLKKGTGAQWRAELMKQGVKLEELKDSGLDAYLNDKATSPLTLQDIIAEREAKRVELHVVMVDDGGKTYVPVEQGAPTPESLELDALKAEFSDLNLKSALAGIIGRDPGNVNTWLRNRVMDRLEADALAAVRANPEAFETAADPRHPVYIIDREGEVRGKLVMKNVQSGQSTDLGWIDPINHRYGGREKRSKEVNKKVLDDKLQEMKRDFVRLLPRQSGQEEIIIPIKPRDDTDFYYYPVKDANGQTLEIIEGTNYNDVVTAVREYYQRSKVEFSFEYEPLDTSTGRYRAIEIKRGQHTLTTLDPSVSRDVLEGLVSTANARHEQRWLEQTAQRHAHKMTLDGDAAFNAAVDVIRDGYSVGERIEELYPSIAYALATEYRHPSSMNSPYPHLDTDRLNRMRELEDRVIGGSYGGGNLRFSSWTLPGGNFRREYLITAPKLPFTAGENVSTHFSDYADQNVVAHLRLAEFYTAEGEVMNMSDEFQSDVMQRASEAREQLIKEYGFEPRPDLGFGAKATDEEFSRKWDEAQVLAAENRGIFQNSRALVGALQDQVSAITLSGDFGGQTELFKQFGMNLVVRNPTSALSDSARAPHLAARFLSTIMSAIETFGKLDERSSLSDMFIEAMRDVYEGSSGRIDGDKATRDEFIRKATAFMKAVPIPEEKRIFAGVDNMYDAFRVGLKTIRPMNEIVQSRKKHVRQYTHDKVAGHGVMIAPERTPHKKSWGLLTFKVALVDAVRRGHQWVGFTTGEQQNTRYRSALQKAVSNIKFKKLGDGKVDVTIKLREGGDDKVLKGMTNSELARYIGRGASDQIFDHPGSNGSLSGDNIRFNLPGVMDHYDRGIPKEIRPLTDKLKMKLVMKEVGELDTNGMFDPRHTVQALRITPEAVEAVKKGEVFRYQVKTDDLSDTLESQLDNVLMPDSPVRTKLKKGTGDQWRAELTKQGVKLEELRDSGLDDYLTENKDQQLSIDQIFQQRQGNRIDIVMKVLDDGTEPLVQRSKEVKVIQPDEPFDLVEKLDEYGLREQTLSERFDDAIREWIDEDDDFDNENNPRYPYEARERNEVVYELVRHEPNGDIEDYVDTYDDDQRYAYRQLRERYGDGEREYVADKPSQEGEEWVVVIRDEWGDGNVVETIKAASEDEAESQAAEFIKENSPYYSIQEGETNDWGVYDISEDKWDDTGLTKREAERSAESSNDHHLDYWYEQANNEAWDILRGDVDRAVELLEQIMDNELDRSEYNELREMPMYDEAVRAYLASEHRIGTAGGGGGRGRSKPNSTKFGNWVLRGGRYYREYLLAAPNMDNQGIQMRTHFNGVEKNILAHFRANDFQTADGGVALVAQEFQSDVHQDASDARQTLIKKLGFEPSPTLGYGDSFQEVAREKAKPLSERVDTFNENIESMSLAIANGLISKMDDIIDAIGLDAFTKTGATHPTLREEVNAVFKQFLSRLASDRDHFKSTELAARNSINTLSYFRYNVNEFTFAEKLVKALKKLPAASNVFPGAQSMEQELRFAAKQIGKLRKSLAESRQALSDVSNIRPVAPERLPFKQSWELLQFKILLHEAIKNGYDYIALTTGDQQVERYGSALKDAIKDIDYDINRDTGKSEIKINLNRKDPHKMSSVTEQELARYIGKEAASRVFNTGQDKGTLPSSGVEFKSPGIINHYDRAIQSDTKKFLASLDMKWESIDIGSVTRISPPPAPKQQWTLIQRGTRPDGTVHEATVVRDTREAIDMIRENARNIQAEQLRDVHGYISYSDELIEPTATNLPAPVEETKFNKMHTVHGVKISDKARMWMQGSPEQPTKRFLKYQVETPDHSNDDARLGMRAKPGDNINTPEFTKWFKKSAAVDRDGRPLPMYRGTQKEPKPTGFATRKATVSFTPDPHVSSVYTQGPWGSTSPGASVHPVFLSIQKPFDMRAITEHATLAEIVDLLPWDFSKNFGDGKVLGLMDLATLIASLDETAPKGGAKYRVRATTIDGTHDIRSFEELSDEINSLDAEELSEAELEHVWNMLYDATVDTYAIADDQEWVDALKSFGYDGIVHKDPFVGGFDKYEGNKGLFELGHNDDPIHDTWRPFEQTQIKSVFNRGTWSEENKDIRYQVELPDGLTHADPAVNTPRFKVWFKKSKIIDAVGHPLRVFHGSLKTFSAFNSGWGTNEGFFGRRFYFTNHPGDASDNYASRQGPDNKYKMEKFLDQNDGAIPEDYWSKTDNDGVVYPVYLSIQNPVIVGGFDQTRFMYRDMVRLAQAAKHAEGLTKIFDGHGKLSDIITEIMMDEVPGSGDYIPANQLIEKIRNAEGVYEIMDENGDNAYAEVLRQAFETMGYDGIVDYGVNSRWKWIKHQNVEHFIAFRPNQIKSVFNRGTWSSRLDDIHYQVSTDDPVKSPKFRAWFDGALLQTADGEPLPVFHATGNDFDKFRRAKYDIGFHIGTAGQANERAEVKSINSENNGVQYNPSVMKLYTNIRNPITLKDLGGWDTPSVWYQLLNMADDPNQRAPLTKDEVLEFALQYQDATGVWKPNSLFHLKKLLSSKGYDSIVYNNKFEIEGKVAAEKRLEMANINLRKAIEAKFPGREPWRQDPNLSPAEYAEVLAAEHQVKQIRMQQVPSYIAFWPTQLKSVFNKGTWSGKMRSVMYQTQWEDAPQSSSFLDSLREGFAGEWEGLDEEAALSSDDVNLRKVYRKDWLDMRKSPNQFQFALMLRGQPIGRINGVINGDTARINWLGIIGGDEGLGDGAIRHLGAMLRLALPNEVRLLTGLRKGPEEAYAAEEQKTAKKSAPSGPSATKVRTPGGSQEDPLIEYYLNLGRYQ